MLQLQFTMATEEPEMRAAVKGCAPLVVVQRPAGQRQQERDEKGNKN